MNKQKRINIVSKEGTAMRVSYSLGLKLVIEDGTHYFTTKGKMKSLINREKKLKNNFKTLNHLDLKKGNSNWEEGRMEISKMPWSGRIAAKVSGFIPDKKDKDDKPAVTKKSANISNKGGCRDEQWFILKF